MKIADMRRTKAEKTAEEKRWKGGPASGAEDYPHGLHIDLDHDGLTRLGLKDTPKPGDEFEGQFHGRVTEASENSDENSKEPRRRVRMLLHHVGVEPKKDTKSLRDELSAASAEHDLPPKYDRGG